MQATSSSSWQNRIQQACFEACGVADPTRHDPVVKWADNLMLRYEMNSHWGYGRIASWRQPLTDAEQTHADEAAARTGFPDENPHTQYVRFIRMAALLTPISALLRTSIDNAGQAEPANRTVTEYRPRNRHPATSRGAAGRPAARRPVRWSRHANHRQPPHLPNPLGPGRRLRARRPRQGRLRRQEADRGRPAHRRRSQS